MRVGRSEKAQNRIQEIIYRVEKKKEPGKETKTMWPERPQRSTEGRPVLETRTEESSGAGSGGQTQQRRNWIETCPLDSGH